MSVLTNNKPDGRATLNALIVMVKRGEAMSQVGAAKAILRYLEAARNG